MYVAGAEQVCMSDHVGVQLPNESVMLQHRHHTGPHDSNSQPLAQYHCQHCHLPMLAGEVAVICQRAGPDKVSLTHLTFTNSLLLMLDDFSREGGRFLFLLFKSILFFVN